VRPLPDSAFGRSALLIGLTLVVSQLAVFALVRHLVVGPAAEQMASLLADQAALAETLLAAAPPAERPALLARLGQGQELRIDLSAQGPPGVAPWLFYQQSFARLLARRLGESIGFRVQTAPETVLWVRPGPESPFWLGMSARRLEQGIPGLLVLWLVLVTAIAAGGGFVLARYLNWHLERLARTAGEVARGRLPERFVQDGPREIRALGQALDRMAGDIRRIAEDRALLLAGISHDLRTPLARIRLSLEMLGEVDEEIRQGIAEDVEEMDATIGQFIATVRDGHDELPVECDLNAQILGVCARIARVRQAPETRLADLPPLPLRPTATERMLINLIENAYRHGAPPVEVSSRRTPGGVRVAVLDRGPGVPEGEIERLFEPFARGRTQGGGSGLGLVIARRIARLHGGEASLHNRPDGGLEARVDLPLPPR
jgi:two-component system osmolarity sensor histidine kinase EnvZ